MSSTFLQDDSGNASSMRLIFAFTLLFVILTWMVISYEKRILQEIPWSVLSLLALLVSGKVVQRREDTMFRSTGSDCIGVSEVISICFLDLVS